MVILEYRHICFCYVRSRYIRMLRVVRKSAVFRALALQLNSNHSFRCPLCPPFLHNFAKVGHAKFSPKRCGTNWIIWKMWRERTTLDICILVRKYILGEWTFRAKKHTQITFWVRMHETCSKETNYYCKCVYFPVDVVLHFSWLLLL